MTKALFLVTSLGVPQSITLLNLLSFSPAGAPRFKVLKPSVPPTTGAGFAGAPPLAGSGANKLRFKASISLYLYVLGGSIAAGWTPSAGAVNANTSFSLGLFFMKETSFG